MISRYEQFTFAISCIHRCIQKIEREEMEKCGYKGVFAQYLAAMYRHPEGLTSMQLSEICDKDKAAVSRAVGEMTDMNLIYRQSVTDTDSHYRALLLLTHKGRKAAQYVCDRAQAAVEAGGEGLSDHSRQIFYESMELIAENLEKISKDGLPQK